MTDTETPPARCNPNCPACALLEAMDRRPWVWRVVEYIGNAAVAGLERLLPR